MNSISSKSKNCNIVAATDIVLTIKHPWWAFWRKNRVISIPNANITYGDIKQGDNGKATMSVKIDAEAVREEIEKQL